MNLFELVPDAILVIIQYLQPEFIPALSSISLLWENALRIIPVHMGSAGLPKQHPTGFLWQALQKLEITRDSVAK
jgi:hypothetical protein